MTTHFGRRLLTVGATAAALIVACPAWSAAAPIGDAIDLGSSAIDLGSSVLDLGSSAIGLGDGISSELGSSGPGGSQPGPAPITQPCNASTKSGGAGVTDTNHILGVAGPTSFVLDYETYNIPDQIEVFYEGGLVATTGYVGDNTNQGTGSIVVNLPPGADTAVTVRVTGPSGTDWDYIVNCP